MTASISMIDTAAATAGEAGPSAAAIEQSLTKFVLDKLDGPSKQLFAVSFAAQMSVDKHALVFDIADALTWLGIDCIDSALKLLTRHFKEGDYKVVSIHHPAAEDPKAGRPSKRYLISLDMFEDLLMLADTKQGRDARKMYKQLRDAVQDYMKMEAEMEMEKRAQIANERLAIGEGKLAELEAVQSKLQATIESQRRREEKKEARKKQQKQPLETVYLISNSPSGQGPFKCGMTEKEAKHRAKAMQTGNHEPVIVVVEIPCRNAELVEKIMHHIFYDYRTNDKLEWFDAPLCSMMSTLRFVVESVDGLSRVDHDEIDVSEHLESVLAHMEGVIVPVKEAELEAVEEEIESELEGITESEAELEAVIEDSEAEIEGAVQEENESVLEADEKETRVNTLRTQHVRELDSLRTFVEGYLRLDMDKNDKCFKLRGEELYSFYKQVCEHIDIQPVEADLFYKKMKIVLADNHNNKQARHAAYIGILRLSLTDSDSELEAVEEETEASSSHSGTDSVQEDSNPLDEKNAYALFCNMFVESSDLPQAHFTMVDAKMKWMEFGTWLMDNGYSQRRIPTPKESDFRNGLVAHLNVPCHGLKRLPLADRADTPKRSWFPGHILVNSCSDDV